MKSIIVCLAIITISLIFTAQTYAKIDFETALGSRTSKERCLVVYDCNIRRKGYH